MLGLEDAPEKEMPFGRKNYLWMVSGVLVIVLGFILMASDSSTFGFGFIGLTLGPILVMAGFIIEFFAILKKDNSNSAE